MTDVPPLPSRSLLPGSWDCPKVFRARLGEQAGRQRLMQADGHLLLVLHAPPKADQDQREGRFFWRQPDGTWSSSHQGGGPQAIMRLLAEYDNDLDAYDVREQAAKSARDYFDLLTNTTPMFRAVANLHAVLQETRTACRDDRQLIVARDKAYELMRRAELLTGDVKHGLDYAMAYRAEQQAVNSHYMAQSAHRLNVLAAFFFPIAALTALFGVNLKTGLEESAPPWPFIGVLAVGMFMGMILARMVVARPKDNGPV